MKLSELCKNRSKKSNPDMFNFYVVLTSHDTVTDVGRAPTFRRNFNSSLLQTKSTKNERPFENMDFNGKPVWRFQTERRTETIFSTFQKEPNGKQRTLQVSIHHCSRKKVRVKIEKTWKERELRWKPLEICKTRTKKSSPDMFNFYVVLAGHDIITDAGRSIKCRWKCKVPWFQTKYKKWRNFRKQEFLEKTVWRFQQKNKLLA